MWKPKLEAEAVEAVNFLWKRKHFDERDWKRKRNWKRPILSVAGSGSESSKVKKRKRTRKHKTLKGVGSGSSKNLTASAFLNKQKLLCLCNAAFG